MGSVQVTMVDARSALTAQSSRSSIPFDYTINPYRGCAFGCSYCYASRFVHEDAAKKADWGYWVEAKQNIVDALGRDSQKLFGKSIFFSSATDPYQPLELRLGLTRALLETLLIAFPSHLHIQTRSPHVVRDIDLFKRFGDSLVVGISIPTDSEIVRRAFEPRAPSIKRRLDAARQLREAGIRTTASVAPLLPATPKRLARLLQANFDRAWVDGLRAYEKADALQAIYTAHGWQRFQSREHVEATRDALAAAGLMSPRVV